MDDIVYKEFSYLKVLVSTLKYTEVQIKTKQVK